MPTTPEQPTVKTLIASYTDGMQIQAIKEIRANCGIGLKDAKAVTDLVKAGQPQEILAIPSAKWEIVNAVTVKPVFSVKDFAAALSHYPTTMTVGEMLAVLNPTAKLAEA